MEKTNNKKQITLLLDLIQLFESLFPQQETNNPYSLLESSLIENNYFYASHEEDVKRIYNRLVHYFTCLNSIYRVQIKGVYESTREDNLLALNLLKDENLTDAYLGKEHRASYRLLMSYLGLGTAFTSKEGNAVLQLPHTTYQRHLKLLREKGYIKVISGSRYKGYVYELIDRLAVKNEVSFSSSDEEEKKQESAFEQALPNVKVNFPL